ncbi:MAG: DUF4422 domain-containing protein [Streptococcaceae bacterium]|jgi:lipopolysaccharide biosynthesis glycosyltransferase|nr:DUF4422 domain-containing protein [Streptococcaceae bacterium]
MADKVKILVGYHKIAPLLKSEIFEPIHLGANGTKLTKDFLTKDSEKEKLFFRNMLSDDIGDNISERNSEYNELTALYFAWKNYELLETPAYIGYMHYRRHFIFNENVYHDHKKNKNEKAYSKIDVKFVSNNYQRKYGLDDTTVLSSLENFDIILPELCNFSYTNHPTVLEDFSNIPGLFKEDLLVLKEVLSEEHPEYLAILNKILKGKQKRCYQMFILKKDIFFDYCEFLFPILDKIDRKLDTSNYSINGKRTLGYLAELLYDIYFREINLHKNYRVKELGTTFILSDASLEEPRPFFHEEQITVASNFSDSYAPIYSVFLQTALHNISDEKNYEFIIFSSNLSDNNRKKILAIASNRNNVNLTFINPGPFLDIDEMESTDSIYTKEVYFRPLIPHILKNFQKIIIIDVDLLVMKDLAELYEINLQDKIIAAVKDCVFMGFLNGSPGLPNVLEYATDYMKLENPYDYVNTGVMVVDIDKYINLFSYKSIVEHIKTHEYLIYDQDMFNAILNGKIFFLDPTWNVYTYTNEGVRNAIVNSRVEDYKAYEDSRKNPRIIHYAAHPKPWEIPVGDFSTEFWECARESGYYEELLSWVSMGIARSNLSAKEKIAVSGKNLELLNKLAPMGTRRRKTLRFLNGNPT